MVEFWINTLAPLFWMTIGKPVDPLNAPSAIVLAPVDTWVALVLETVPLEMAVELVLAPPRKPARDASLRPRAGAAPKTLRAAVAEAEAGATAVVVVVVVASGAWLAGAEGEAA